MKPNLTSLRQYVNTTMTATGEIGTVSQVQNPNPPFDMIETFNPEWTGRMLVYPLNLTQEVVSGGAEYTVTKYAVTLPTDALVVVGKRMQVTVSPDGPELIGMKFSIVDAPGNAWSVARQCVAAVVT